LLQALVPTISSAWLVAENYRHRSGTTRNDFNNRQIHTAKFDYLL